MQCGPSFKKLSALADVGTVVQAFGLGHSFLVIKGVQCILGPAPCGAGGGGTPRGGRTTWAGAGTVLVGAPSGWTAGGAAHRCEPGEDTGSLQDVTPRPAPAQSRAALHGAPQQQGDAEPRSHTGRCGESRLWGARSQARPRLEKGSGGCSGLHPLARAGPWAPRVTSILAPLSFPPPPPLSTLIQHPQSHWGSAAFERIHVS